MILKVRCDKCLAPMLLLDVDADAEIIVLCPECSAELKNDPELYS